MITKRGKRVRAGLIFFALGLALWSFWQVTANLWATPSGWCWGSMVECVQLQKEGNKKRNFTGVGLSPTGFVGSVCGSLPPGRRTLKRESAREHAKEREGN